MDELTELELAIRNLFRTIKRPQYWSLVTARAGIVVDRPAAMLLHVLNAESGTPLRGHDLAQRLSIEAPSITRKTQELEKAGYLIRQPDPKDGRASSFAITASGRAASKKLWQAQRSIINEALGNWTADEQQQFTALFQRFANDITHVTTN